MKIKRAAANFALLLSALVIALLLCEGISRLLLDPVDFLSPSIERNDILGIAVPPHSGGHDGWGFRNKRVPPSSEIVAIGDSHTYGNAAKMVDSWPFQVEHITGNRVYNLGLGGYGPNQYLYLLKNRALALGPRTILCGFWMGDDFDNALKITYGLEYWKALRDQAFSLPAGSWDIWEQPVRTTWHKDVRIWLSSHSMTYRLLFHGLLDGLRGRAQIQSELRKGDRTPVLDIKNKKILEAFYSPRDILSGLDQADKGVREGMRISFGIIREMEAACRDKGIVFILVVIPTKELVFSDYLMREPKIVSGDVIAKIIANENEARNTLFAFLTRENVRYIDTFPALKQAAGHERIYAFGLDTHPNRNGYRIIAETVAPAIAKLPR